MHILVQDRLLTGCNTGKHCANSPGYADTRPGPASTGGSISRVEQLGCSICAGTLLGRVVQIEEALPAGAAQFARVCMEIHVQGR